jgi:putative nucleotidyltransferase with HDIG domain
VDREKREVRPVAQAGFEEGFLSTLKFGTDELPDGLGLAGIAVQTRRPSVMRYAESDPASAPWRAEALRRGYRSSVSLPIEHEHEVVATLNVYSEREDAFDNEELPFLVEVTGDMGVGLRSLRLEQRLEHSLAAVERMVDGTVQAISLMGEMRDPYTAGHQRRVADLAVAIGKEMGLSADVIQGLHIAGLLHDVGKIAVPAEILSKPGKISDYEFAIIKSHPGIGKQILQGVQFPWPVAQAVVQHHERLDGRGYPDGLKGDAIIREARILAVSDVVEAMSSHRPYRAALGIDKALEEILRGKGVGYDAEVANACAALFREKRFAFDEGGTRGT